MSLSLLSLARPWWLLALLPLAVLLWREWRAPQRSAAFWRRLVDAHLLPQLLVLPAPAQRRAGFALLAFSLLAAVLALAGPTLEAQPQQTYRRDVVRLVALELSPAMTARLEQVKPKLLALLRALPDGQSALLVYGGEPYLVAPPTSDIETIARFVPELATDAIPTPGNRPQLALKMAVATLSRSAAQQRELIWITAGSAGAALPLDALAGIRLSILHVADNAEPALAEAARRSGGMLAPIRADDGDIRQLIGALQAHSGWVAAPGSAGGDTELGYWLLPLLLPLAALAFRRGILVLLPLLPLLAALLAPPPAAAFDVALPALLADVQGWRLLAAGEPEAAAARFADPRWRAAALYRAGQFGQAASLLAAGNDADSHYNRGNALARQGQLADALAAYDAALKLRPDDADARHNRDLVQQLLKQPPPAPRGGNPPPSNKQPPPPAPGQAPGQSGNAEREAAQLAEQWLRRIPDQPATLLRRKLLAEQRQRQAGSAERAW